MQTYTHRSVNDKGQITEGIVEASSIDAAASKLVQQGLTPLDINDAHTNRQRQSSLFASPWTANVSKKDIELFTEQLATLIKAGLPLTKALDIIAKLSKKDVLSKLIVDIRQEINNGRHLSEALQTIGKPFDRLYIQMIRAGESSGNLHFALDRLAYFKTTSREAKETLISTLIYPTILVVLSIISIAIMLAYVVPQFSELFSESGKELPLLTQAVIAIGHFFSKWWWLVLASILGLYFYHRQRLEDDAYLLKWHKQVVGFPIIGSFIIKQDTARFCRSLATLLDHGNNLLVAIDISKEIVGNRSIANKLSWISSHIGKGQGIAEPMKQAQTFPPLAIQLISVGEETGQLSKMLNRVAEIYDKELKTDLKRMLSVVEPLIIVIVAAIVTVIILSVVLMILDSNNLPF